MHTFTYVLKIFVIYDMINLGRTKEGGNEGFKKGYNKRWKVMVKEEMGENREGRTQT